MTGIFPPSVEPTPTVNPSLRYWRSEEKVRSGYAVGSWICWVLALAGVESE